MLKIYSLFILLVIVLTVQYYILQEGFENAVANGTVDTKALDRAVGTINPSSQTAPNSDTSSDVIQVVPASPEAVDANDKMTVSKFLRNVQDTIRNELMSNRSITNSGLPLEKRTMFGPGGTQQTGSNITPMCHQGNEFNNNCPKDMSEYIRKDAIPCWGCTLK
jgi:hypothetical protein